MWRIVWRTPEECWMGDAHWKWPLTDNEGIFLFIKASFEIPCPWTLHKPFTLRVWKTTWRGTKRNDSLQTSRSYLHMKGEPWHTFTQWTSVRPLETFFCLKGCSADSCGCLDNAFLHITTAIEQCLHHVTHLHTTVSNLPIKRITHWPRHTAHNNYPFIHDYIWK